MKLYNYEKFISWYTYFQDIFEIMEEFEEEYFKNDGKEKDGFLYSTYIEIFNDHNWDIRKIRMIIRNHIIFIYNENFIDDEYDEDNNNYKDIKIYI